MMGKQSAITQGGIDLKKITAIFLFGLCCFLLGNSHGEFVNFQSRFALFAQDMQGVGIHFFPTIYGEAYPDYTALSTLLVHFCARLFGDLSVFVAVIPTATVSAITLVLTYLIVEPLCKKWAFYSVFFLLLTVCFFGEARSISLDQAVTTVTCACFYFCSVRLDQNNKAHFFLLMFLLFLGFIFRGPIGFIIPWAVVSVYFLIDKQYSYCAKVVCFGVIFFLLCIILFFGAAYVQGGYLFLKKVLHMQVTARIINQKKTSCLFYLVALVKNFSVASMLCLSTLLSCGFSIYKKRYDKQNRLVLFLLGWVFIIVVGMSIPAVKKTRYILPVSPALAIIGAYLFVEPGTNFFKKSLILFWKTLFIFLPSIAILALIYLVVWSSGAISYFIFSTYNQILFAVFLLILLQILVFFCFKKSAFGKLVSLSFCSFFVVYVLVVEPGIYSVNSAKNFVMSIENARKKQNAPLFFYKIGKDSGAVKYFVNVPYRVPAFFITTGQELSELKHGYVIMRRKDFDGLSVVLKNRFSIVNKGAFGRLNAIALQPK